MRELGDAGGAAHRRLPRGREPKRLDVAESFVVLEPACAGEVQLLEQGIVTFA
ncbi:MAG: hypothetical protein ACREMQ_02455 [Longimicrobiales bacterium]